MATVTSVKELPIVDNELLPELPEDFTGKFYVIFDSKWQHAEEEYVASLVLTAAARRGKWEAIPWIDIVALIKDSSTYQTASLIADIGIAVHRVADSGDIQLVTLGKQIYLIPTPVLAETIKGSAIRYI